MNFTVLRPRTQRAGVLAQLLASNKKVEAPTGTGTGEGSATGPGSPEAKPEKTPPGQVRLSGETSRE